MTLTNDELDLFERAVRALVEQARTDAERLKGTSLEGIHLRTQARFLRLAERLKAARNAPDRSGAADVERAAAAALVLSSR